MNPTKFLRRKEAGEYLRNKFGEGSARTLGKLAHVGGGPIFRKLGRTVVYTEQDLDDWMFSRLSGPRRSTCDAGQ